MPRQRTSAPPEGTVYRHAKGWQAKVVWAKPDGTVRTVKRNGRTRYEAVTRLAEARDSLTRERAADSFDALADRYLSAITDRPHTLRTMRTQLRVPREVFGARQAASLTTGDVQAAVDASVARGLSPATVHHQVQAVRSVLALIGHEAITTKVRKPRLRPFVPKHVSTQDVLAIVDSMRGSPSWPLIAAIAATGMRISEARGLRWQDVGEDRITVAGQVAQDGASHAATKTLTGVRTVAIGPRLAEALSEARSRLQGPPQPSGWVFARPDGSPWSDSTARAAFRLAQIAMWGRASLRVHDLRHHYIVAALQAGADIPSLARVMGHKPQTLVAHYAWALPDAADRMRDIATAAGIA
jgi:integrase